MTRNLEIIGEAVKHLPDKVRDCSPEIEWKKIAGLRDILIHQYFGMNVTIIWDIAHQKVPELLKRVRRLLDDRPAVDAVENEDD